MTRKLIIHDGHSQRELLLIGTIVVGRDPSCHITDLDPLLSRRHAEFVTTADSVTVRDLGSRNGMLVNGEKVDEQVLAEGDLVQLGHLQVRYVERLSVYTPEAKIRSHATTAMSMEAANRAAGLAPGPLGDRTPRESAAPDPDSDVTHAPAPRDNDGTVAVPASDADPTVAPVAKNVVLDATFVPGPRRAAPDPDATFVPGTKTAADLEATFAAPAGRRGQLDATFAPSGIDVDATFVPSRRPPSAAVVTSGAEAQLVAGYDLRITSASAGCRAVFGAAPETLVGQALGDLVARSLRAVAGGGGPSSLSLVVERSSSDRTLTMTIKAGPLPETAS